MTKDQDLSKAVASEIKNEWLTAIEKHGGTHGKIARELCTIAFSDIRNYLDVNPDGSVTLIDLDKITPRKASRAIKSIKQTTKSYVYQDEPVTEVKTEFQLWDKQDALAQLVELRGDKPHEQLDLNVVKPLVVIHRGGREKPEDAENVG